MQYRALGRTGLNVSTVAMGCWAIAGGSVIELDFANAAVDTRVQFVLTFLV